MTSNFSSKFSTLRKERKLSIRDISLMTGVSTKEVKKWDKGTAIPNGSRIASALEGLLGEDICKDFSFMEDQVMDGNLRGKPFFSVDETIFKERKNRIGRLKEKVFPEKTKQHKNPTDYIKIEPSEEIVNTGLIATVADVDVAQKESVTLEYPYINDPDQIMTYWKRNIKTFLILILLLIVGFRSFYMFWENVTLFIDNLI
jgi:predicted transcriptional regulator